MKKGKAKIGMKGLIVKDPWATKILTGEKTIEIRGSNTNQRGKIGIIKSRTKRVFGTVEVVDSIRLTEEDFNALRDKHKVDCKYSELPYKNVYGWVLENPVIYNEPQEVNVSKGCIIWVNV